MIRDIFEAIINILKSRILYASLIILGLFSVLFVRLFNLQIYNEEYYMNTYIKKAEKTIYNQATRGMIYDRNGNVLAYNELAYAVTIEDTLENNSQRSKKLNKIIENAINIIEENGDNVIDDFGIRINRDGTFEYTMESENAIKTFLINIYGKELKDDKGRDITNASAREVFDYLCNEKYEINSGLGNEFDLKIAMVRYKLTNNNYQKYMATTLALNVSDETVAAISEAKADITGVSVTQQSIRRYNDSEYFAPIIGYTGTISEDQLAEYTEDGEDYLPNDIVGKAGIESAFEYELSGTRGSQTVFVDSTGKILDVLKTEDSVTGNNIYLTIDSDLTKATYKLLEQKIAGILSKQLVSYDIDYKKKNKQPVDKDEYNSFIISIKQVYYQMINNDVLDISHFKKKKASDVEKAIYGSYKDKLESVRTKIKSYLGDNPVNYNDLSDEYQEYTDFIFDKLVDDNIIIKSQLDDNDETYKDYLDGKTSLKNMIMYAISMNWININSLDVEGEYITSEDTYNAIINYINDEIEATDGYAKLIYYYCLYGGSISGTQICLALYDQGVLTYNKTWYNKLQAYDSSVTYKFMKSQINSLNITPAQVALDPCSGSTVITDPNNGQVLALVTYPSYDNNKLSGQVDYDYWQNLLDDESAPMYNRATQTITAPGSTFKMVSAMTGLENNYITTESTYVCTGEFTEITPHAKCWIYPRSHGSENVVEAIKDSCNCFFYNLAYDMSFDSNGDYDSAIGLAKLEKYATDLGLNKNTGLEITETAPKFSTESSVRSAIGQGSHGYTCSQLARYVSTVANGGTNYYLTLFKKETDKDGKKVKKNKKKVENTVEVKSSTWDAIHKGMRLVVSDGTVRSIYKDMKIKVAGKTGTAEENKRRNTHSLFVCYAPYDNPEIALATVIPYGDASSNASEIARDIIKYYYGEIELDDILNGNANLPEVESSHND